MASTRKDKNVTKKAAGKSDRNQYVQRRDWGSGAG